MFYNMYFVKTDSLIYGRMNWDNASQTFNELAANELIKMDYNKNCQLPNM